MMCTITRIQMVPTDKFTVLLVVLVALVALSTTAQLPAHSWDTVPVFQQLCRKNATVANPISKRDIDFLSDYPVVIFEHCEGYYQAEADPDVFLEDVARAAAKGLKDGSTKIGKSSPQVFIYNNENAALPWYRYTQSATLDPMKNRTYFSVDADGHRLTFDGGHMLTNGTTWQWNQTAPGWVDWYSDFCVNVTTDSDLDGVFVDTAGSTRGDAGYENQVLQEMHRKCNSADKIVIAHNPGIVNLDPVTSPIGWMPYTFGSKPGSDIASMLKWITSGEKLMFAHGQTNAVPDQDNAMLPFLATFLVAANNHSYFGYSTNPGGSGDHFCSGVLPSWCAGMGTSELLTKPLGAPLGAANVHTIDDGANGPSTSYQRKFSKGTTVSLVVGSNNQAESCSITWGDGTTSVCIL